MLSLFDLAFLALLLELLGLDLILILPVKSLKLLLLLDDPSISLLSVIPSLNHVT